MGPPRVLTAHQAWRMLRGHHPDASDAATPKGKSHHPTPKTMKHAAHKWVFVDNLLISVSTSGLIPSDVWSAFIDSIKRSKATTRYLATTIGSIDTTSLQRKEVFDLVKSKGIRVAVVTDEKVTRGIVTAASWVGVDAKAFAWSNLREALQALDVAPDLEEQAVAAVTKLKNAM